MVDEIIPEDIKQFIIQYIDSIAQCEAVLLLREHPEMSWDVEKIANRLYITEVEAEMLLKKTLAHGFIVAQGSNNKPLYTYQPQSADIRNKIGRLADLYSRYLIPITGIIHSKSNKRIQQFADAFRIRKDI